MNENAKRWVEELRSGRFEQTQHALRRDDAFCCLGVACEISGVGTWSGDLYTVGGRAEANYLPKAVQSWLGLISQTGEGVADCDGYITLTELNDNGGKSFAEIADAIEANADQLFQPPAPNSDDFVGDRTSTESA